MEKYNPRIISIANRKGGVGKSTVTMLLAGVLAEERAARVLVLDTDEQQSISDSVKIDAQLHGSASALYSVEACPPGDVIDRLGGLRARYDVIFIDAPRVTESKTDVNLGRILAVCDAVLVPVLGSTMDVLSTIPFVRMLEDIADFKRKNGLPFEYAGFINRANARKENRDAMEVLEKNGLPFMQNAIPDLKVFAAPSAYLSVLYARGGIRFYPFLNEFYQRFKI